MSCTLASFTFFTGNFKSLTEALAEKLENFELDWEQLAEDIGDELLKQWDRLIELPPIDLEIVDKLMANIEDIAWDFSYELIWRVNEPFKNIQYKFDEFGNW